MKLTTTLAKIRACSPCASGWKTLNNYLGKDFDPNSEFNLLTILESNGVIDTLWALRATVQDSKNVSSQLTIEFAEQVLPIFEKVYPDDKRPRCIIQFARDYIEGKIDLVTLKSVRDDAYATYDVRRSASGALSSGALAAAYAASTAYTVSWANTAHDAYAIRAAYAVYAANESDDAKVAARQMQAEIIRKILE